MYQICDSVLPVGTIKLGSIGSYVRNYTYVEVLIYFFYFMLDTLCTTEAIIFLFIAFI